METLKRIFCTLLVIVNSLLQEYSETPSAKLADLAVYLYIQLASSNLNIKPSRHF